MKKFLNHTLYGKSKRTFTDLFSKRHNNKAYESVKQKNFTFTHLRNFQESSTPQEFFKLLYRLLLQHLKQLRHETL